MKKIKVQITNSQAPKDYTIFIGKSLIEELNSLINFSAYTKAVVLADSNIPKALVQGLQKSLPLSSKTIFLRSGEGQKSLTSIQYIWQELFNFGCDRKSLLVNLGGGMVLDTGGFAAATFLRGIDFLQIPTTLLAQIDASIGGKVAINYLGVKNLIGAFKQPAAVVIDINTLSALPVRELISGFAEIIKHGLIFDKKYFQLVTAKKPTDFSEDELLEIIEKSCLIKTAIISQDEKEKNLRKTLNFGHTIGHAIESLSQRIGQPLHHGEAVSIGMAAAGDISEISGLLSADENETLKQALIKAGLPVKTADFSVDQILQKIKADKKNENGQTRWVLLKSIGSAVTDRQVDDLVVRQVL